MHTYRCKDTKLVQMHTSTHALTHINTYKHRYIYACIDTFIYSLFMLNVYLGTKREDCKGEYDIHIFIHPYIHACTRHLCNAAPISYSRPWMYGCMNIWMWIGACNAAPIHTYIYECDIHIFIHPYIHIWMWHSYIHTSIHSMNRSRVAKVASTCMNVRMYEYMNFTFIYVCMDVWGCMNIWMSPSYMDAWIYECHIHIWMYGCMNIWMSHSYMYVWMYEYMNVTFIYGCMSHSYMDSWIYECHIHIFIHPYIAWIYKCLITFPKLTSEHMKVTFWMARWKYGRLLFIYTRGWRVKTWIMGDGWKF